MNQQAEDIMMKSPNVVTKESLGELSLELKIDKKKKLLNFLLFENYMFSNFWIIFF